MHPNPASPEHFQTTPPLHIPNPISPGTQNPLLSKHSRFSLPRTAPKSSPTTQQHVTSSVSSQTSPNPSSSPNTTVFISKHPNLPSPQISHIPPYPSGAPPNLPLAWVLSRPSSPNTSYSSKSPILFLPESIPPLLPQSPSSLTPSFPSAFLEWLSTPSPENDSSPFINPLFSLYSRSISLMGPVNPSSLRIPPI